MLQGDFFTISSIQKENDSVKALLELNASHPIFLGHFPGQPVVPGACLLQMVKEIMQSVLDNKLQLIKAHQLKFLSPIDPGKNKDLQAEFIYSISENKEISVSATFLCGGIACFKFSGYFNLR